MSTYAAILFLSMNTFHNWVFFFPIAKHIHIFKRHTSNNEQDIFINRFISSFYFLYNKKLK